MPAPIDSFVQLPDDSGNTGKKIRSQTRVVGSNTVHEHFFVNIRQAQLLGVYRAAMDQVTVIATTQDGTSTGFLWAHVPTAITNKKVRLRRVFMTSQHSSALATPTAPRLIMKRMTFTGTASGAAVTAAKVDSGYGSPIFDLRTAVTGLTVTLVASIASAAITGAITAIGAYAPVVIDFLPAAIDEDEWIVLAPGEGIAIYQDVAGTGSDTRKANICLSWDEIDTA